MKFLFTWLLLLAASFVIAQSPACNIVLELGDTITPYSIEMKFCNLINQIVIKSIIFSTSTLAGYGIDHVA